MENVSNKKKTIFLIVVGILLVGSILMGVSYAAWVATLSQTGRNVVNTDCFGITFTDKDEIDLQNAFPIRESDAANLKPYEFTIANRCDTSEDYIINLETVAPTNISSEFVRIKIDDEQSTKLSQKTVNDNKVISNAIDARTIIVGNLVGKESKTYRLKMWIDESATVSDVENKSLAAKVTIAGTLNKNSKIITLNLNGGTLDINRVLGTIGNKIGTLPSPTKEGLTFTGWYSDEELENAVTQDTIVTDGLTNLYAKYEILSGLYNSSGEIQYTWQELIDNGYWKVVDGELLKGDNYDSSLEGNLIVDNSVTTIGQLAFSSSHITNITLPNSITTLKKYSVAFSNLESINIPNSVTNISGETFVGSNLLKTVTFDEGSQLTSIPDGLFSSLNIENVNIPDSVTSIGDEAFKSTLITSIDIPDGVTSIGERAFESTHITSIDIPDSVTSIGDRAFSQSNLKNIKLSNNLTTIGERAFELTVLTSIVIPASVTYIGEAAFEIYYPVLTSALTSVEFEDPNNWFITDDKDALTGTSLSSTDLSNTSTAATYLKDTYVNKYWKKSN